MSRRGPRSARLLSLWTAGWLFALLLTGVLWVGDLSVQWPVLLVPVLWALVALRPRRRPRIVAEPRNLDEPRNVALPRDPGPFSPQRGAMTREQPWLPEVPPATGPPREE